MDPFFFLTKHKNFIPHEYPCRTIFAETYRGKRPDVRGAFDAARWWLPFGSPRLDLSGFWFRPTRLATLARTFIAAETAGHGKGPPRHLWRRGSLAEWQRDRLDGAL